MSKDFEFDDEDEAPRSRRPKRRADAPKSRRHEDDEAPRSRRRDDDEDNDVPNSRRARDEDDDDAPRSRRHGKDQSKPRISPLRFVTPGTFGMAILFFFLPWTDLSCSGPTGKMQLVTQSGFQSAMGEASEGEGLVQLRERDEKRTGKKVDAKFDLKELQKEKMQKGGGGKGDEEGPEKAPVLWLYLVVLIAGTIVPVLIAANRPRSMAVIGFSWFAGLLLVVQLVAGFPLANAAAESNADLKKTENVGKGAVKMDGLEDAMKMKSSFLPSFWLSILMIVASGVLGLVQYFVGRAPPVKSRSKQRRRREEDDEEEDED